MAKLHFYYSAMNAGKTTTLLQSSFNYQERGMRTCLLTPKLDDRYGIGKITSRIGLQSDAHIFDKNDNIFELVKNLHEKEKINCVLVDEVQFLGKDHVYQLTEIVDRLNIPVLAYGLRTDYMGLPFPGSMYCMSWADEMVEIKTICHCGRKATHVLRIDEKGVPVSDGTQIIIGGNDSYISVCRKHYKDKEYK